jgi:hypothetical protein
MSAHGGSGGGVVESTLKFVGGFGISQMGFALVLFLIAGSIVASVQPGIVTTLVSIVFASAPLWLPFFLGNALWKLWIRYIRTMFWAKQKRTMLEIKVPREISKSPKAMELVISGMHIGSREGTFVDRNWYGKTRPMFSFEIVSDGGQISFYIWTERFYKELIEAQIYAQYPEVEVSEVEDYALKFHYDEDKYNLFGCDYTLTSPDVLPIKTYIDFGLDKDPKEEFRIDPMAHVMETLSTLKPGEMGWVQIIVQADKDQRHKAGTWFTTEARWKNEAKEMIDAIRKESSIPPATPEGFARFTPLTEGQTEKMKAIERSMDKPQFSTGMRFIYIAEKDKFRGINITTFINMFKQYSSNVHNGFRPSGWLASFDYPWQDFRGIRQAKVKKKLIHAYQIREFFYAEYEAPLYPFYSNPSAHTHPFVLTAEELATLFHFPSSTIKAPGVRRIPATKAEPPPNLPM